MSAASVVVLPLPVGPTTRPMPCFLVTFWRSDSTTSVGSPTCSECNVVPKHPDGYPDPLMRKMALNPESAAAEGAARVLSFTGEIDLPLGDQPMPEVATFTLFPLEALINSALAIQQLQYLGNSINRQFPPLLVRAGRTATVGIN